MIRILRAFPAIVLLGLGCILPAFSQNGTIRGKITDTESFLDLPGATVLIENLNKGTVTDAKGNFTILDVKPGNYTLNISYIGYEPATQTVQVAENKTEEITFRLTPGVMIGDEILILGDRLKGQAKALNQQKSNTNITNIVASDQIGRFPDANIGDALKRVPGITMQNDQGEARDIIIRGMAPQLNSVMINGERIPSAEGDNRRVQMDLIPSDMIQTIEVNKAVTPDMDADAIGGAVNLVTRNAPNGLRISGTLASGYNFLSEKPIWTGGLVVGNRFFDEKLGIVLSGSYNNHQFGSDNVEVEWAEGDNTDAYVTEMEYRKYVVQRIRRSVSASLDFKINPNNKLYFKSIYNHRDDWETRFRLRYRDMGEPDANGVTSAEIVRELKGGLGNDRIDNRRLEDQRTYNLSISGDHLLGNLLKITWSSTYSKASEKRPHERYLEYKAQEAVFNESEQEVDYEDLAVGVISNLSDLRTPYVSLQNPAELSLDMFRLDGLTEEFQDTYEEDFSNRLDFELPLNAEKYNSFLKFGARYRNKTKERINSFFEYEPTDKSLLNPMTQLPLTDESDPGFLAGQTYQVGSFVTPETLGALNLTNTDEFEGESKPEEFLPGNYNAKEKITAGYIMLNQDFGKKLNLIAGLRMEHTHISYTGYQLVLDEEGDVDESQIQNITDKKSYTNILPAILGKYSFSENAMLRFAWTNTLARPNYYDLVPYRNINLEDMELAEGNPELNPTTAMNFDLNVENYFASVGLVSGGVFYKKLKDFVYVFQDENYTDPISGQSYDKYFRPFNGDDASLYGAEIAIQRQLDFLPGFLKGFGIYANYTFTESSTKGIKSPEGEAREELSLPGTAKHMLNASLSYETKKLVLRVSLNHAGSYLDEVGDDAFTDRFYDAQTFLDVNGSYAFTPNLRFFVEANNLTNQPLRYYQGIKDRTMQAEYYNARFNAGFKFDLFN